MQEPFDEMLQPSEVMLAQFCHLLHVENYNIYPTSPNPGTTVLPISLYKPSSILSPFIVTTSPFPNLNRYKYLFYFFIIIRSSILARTYKTQEPSFQKAVKFSFSSEPQSQLKEITTNKKLKF